MRIAIGIWVLLLAASPITAAAQEGTLDMDQALREVMEPIEEEIATIPDVKRIRGNASAGQARMEVMFDWGIDVDIKKMEVREAIDRARPQLPDTIGHISVRGDTDGGSAQVLAGRISAERDLSESWDLLDRRIGRPLERIKGVARVDLYGVEAQQVRIDLDLDALWLGDHVGDRRRIQVCRRRDAALCAER